MSINPWKPLSRRLRTDAGRRKIEDVEFEMPDGSRDTFSLFYMGKAVAILALTTDKKVILARQFRPGPCQILDELPGGGMDDGESPDVAAARELIEETGYSPGTLQYLGSPHECGYSNVERHAYLATNCIKTGSQKLDHGEDIEVVLKPVIEFIQQLVAGQCTDCEVAWMGLYRANLIVEKSLAPCASE